MCSLTRAIVLTAFCGFAISAFGVAVPPLRLAQVIDDSDIVIVGDVQRVYLLKNDVTTYNQQAIPSKRYAADVVVRRLIKGNGPSTLQVHFSIPSIGIGYRAIATGTTLLFLRTEEGHYVPTTPYYPSLPAEAALLAPNLEANTFLGAVINELAAVLDSSSESSDAKWLILNHSYAIPQENPFFVVALKNASRITSDSYLQHRIDAELLFRNDISILPQVSQLILKNTLTATEKNRLLYSIANGIKTEKAVPQLRLLLNLGDSSVRGAVAEALWHIDSQAAVPLLSGALRDPDIHVRYYAIRGLADSTGQFEWGPSIPEFEQNGARYLQHWLAWADEQRARQ